MKRRYKTNGIKELGVLVLVFITLAMTSALRKSPVADEAAHHVPTGYVFLKTGDFVYATDSPPLARCIAALPLLILDIELPDDRDFWARDDRAEFSKEFLYKLNRSSVDRIILLARIPIILLGVFGGCFLFWWVKKQYDPLVAVIAATFYFLSPNILAHARFATTDMAVTVFMACAVFLFWDFLQDQNNKNAIVAGIFLALAMLSKYSAILLAPVYLVIFSIFSLYDKKNRAASKISLLFVFFGTTLLVLWAGYSFEFRPFLEGVLRAEDKVILFQNFLNNVTPFLSSENSQKLTNMLFTCPVPLGSYILGILGVLKHGAEGTSTFFMGSGGLSGNPWYYVVGFLIKTPIPIIILFFAGMVRTVLGKTKNKSLNIYLMAVIIVFFTAASAAKLQLGLRYILPVYPFIFIVAAVVLSGMFRHSRFTKMAGSLLMIWFFIIQIFIWPDYLSYFNETIGGPDNGHKYLRDSNIDWGQDLPALKQYMNANNVEWVYLNYFGVADPTYYGIAHKPMPQLEKQYPPEGVYAISVNYLDENMWNGYVHPIAKAGYSIFIYDNRKGGNTE